ncbi:citrate lyase subunit alpha, partial [Vibrio cholerae]
MSINTLNNPMSVLEVERYTLTPYTQAHAITPHLLDEQAKKSRKVKSSIREAIVDLGLKDGMTISFHHAFRGGDKTVNLVMEVIAELGIKNLTLASSSLTSCHSPLIEHIKNGVVSKIYTSGIRGALADSISNGLLDEPVHIHSHGGRV